ncbi:HpcH/HpaI aldolase/citrate lyase family protein [Candidatus Latescibacterota bacterium]
MKTFKELLSEKETVFGIFAKTNDPFYIKVIGKSGFDFVILDNEHGPNSERETYPLIMAAQLAGMHPIVRVGKISDITIQKTLDLGVSGIQIPQIQSREDAENVRKFTKFHPKGKRGVCRFVAAADGGLMNGDEYALAQNEVAVIIHIEGIEGIQHFDEISEVEDIDVIFIGPYDMSQSLGIPGQVNNPILTKEIEKLVEKCRQKKKHVGIYADNVETAKRYKDLGVKYIGVSVDLNIFGRACSKLAEELNAL